MTGNAKKQRVQLEIHVAIKLVNRYHWRALQAENARESPPTLLFVRLVVTLF